jgi:hypothetical protein
MHLRTTVCKPQKDLAHKSQKYYICKFASKFANNPGLGTRKFFKMHLFIWRSEVNSLLKNIVAIWLINPPPPTPCHPCHVTPVAGHNRQPPLLGNPLPTTRTWRTTPHIIHSPLLLETYTIFPGYKIIGRITVKRGVSPKAALI